MAGKKSTTHGVAKVRSIPLVIILVVLAFLGDGPIRPGSKSLNTNQIPLGTDSLLILIPQNGQLYIGGSLVLQTGLEDYNGKKVLSRVERSVAHDGTLFSVDSFMVAQNSLFPLYQRSQDQGGAHKLDLGNMNKPAFYGNSMDLILASLPLRSGYEAHLALTDEKGNQIANIQVIGMGSIKTAEGEECNSWEIQVNASDNSGIYWLSDPGRVLVRYAPAARNMIIARIRGCPASI